MTDDAIPQGGEWPQAGVGSRQAAPPRREAAPMRFFATLGFMFDTFRRRRSGRIVLWTLVVALAGAGITMLTYPLITDVWASRTQTRLEREFKAMDPGGFGQGTFKDGQALTRLRIPTLKVNVIVVEGWSGNALRAGAGHRPGSALPGDPTGNVAIAGHRTGFGEPFRHLDRMRPGDKIFLETPLGRFTYEVVREVDGHGNPYITNPHDLSVANPNAAPYGALTLITCDPPHTSKMRLIVRARLVTGGSGVTPPA